MSTSPVTGPSAEGATSPSSAAEPSVLSLTGASKTFGPVIALADGTIDIRPGEIHALVGENGAGKSTLVKILAGVHAPDGGEFLVGGESVSFKTPADSKWYSPQGLALAGPGAFGIPMQGAVV